MFFKIIKKIKRRFINTKSNHNSKLFFTKDFFLNKKFIIGEYTYGKPNVLFENENANLKIGKFCSIADNVTIFLGGNHRTDWISTYPFNALNEFFPDSSNIQGHPSTKGDVKIGNDVWIGKNVIIMSGISIGDGAVLAAGAVIVKNVGDYEIHGGNPAKLLKLRFKEEEIIKLKNIKWWNWDIEKIKQNINLLCSNNINTMK